MTEEVPWVSSMYRWYGNAMAGFMRSLGTLAMMTAPVKIRGAQAPMA